MPERRTLKSLGLRSRLQLMNEERDLVIRPRRARIAHDQRAEETPIDARIIHVSDAYDAMTTDRSYRRGMTHEKAISEIIENSGIQFDPRIVDVFVNLPGEVFTRHSAEAAPEWVEQSVVVAG